MGLAENKLRPSRRSPPVDRPTPLRRGRCDPRRGGRLEREKDDDDGDNNEGDNKDCQNFAEKRDITCLRWRLRVISYSRYRPHIPLSVKGKGQTAQFTVVCPKWQRQDRWERESGAKHASTQLRFWLTPSSRWFCETVTGRCQRTPRRSGPARGIAAKQCPDPRRGTEFPGQA